MHSAHTLTQSTRTLRPGHAHSARWAPCRRPCPALLWSCRCEHARADALCRSAVLRPSITIQKMYRDSSPCRAPCRSRCRTCRRVSTPCRRAPYRSPWRAMSRRQACSSCHDTIVCIVTHLPAHAVSRPKRLPPATIQYLYRDSTL